MTAPKEHVLVLIEGDRETEIARGNSATELYPKRDELASAALKAGYTLNRKRYAVRVA